MNLSFNQSLSINKLGDIKLLGICLSIGFLIRLIPEMLAYWTPIGFDTIYYGYVMKAGIIMPHWSSFFTSTWLLYALIVPAYNLIQGDPFLILKITGPLLYGLNVAGIYWFSRKMLNWSPTMGLAAGIFFALQLASLRISWDLLRNTLGLGILLFALSYVKEVDTKHGFALFAGFSLLAVFAHEYSAVILLFTVGCLLVWKLFKKQLTRNYKMLALGLLPSLSVFIVGLFLRINPIRYGPQSNIISAGDAVSGKSGVFFLTNYLQIQNSVDYYSNYWMLALNVILLFTVLFVPYIYLVKKGYFKNSILTSWTVLLLVGAFGCLIMPIAAPLYWHRWMFMLVYPFTFYAIFGLSKLVGNPFASEKLRLSAFFSNKKASGMILLTICLGAAYLFTPVTMTLANKSVPNMTGTQVYFSTDPAVPYQDEQNVLLAMNWIKQNSNQNTCIILQHHFLEYGKMYLTGPEKILYYQLDIDQAIAKTATSGLSTFYFVWWNTPIGWNEDPVPDGFVSIADFGRISVYSYERFA
ncbi:MAG: hypothetical protein ACQCN5_08480 [Candidatus Bathyarchaeia archaeon]